VYFFLISKTQKHDQYAFFRGHKQLALARRMLNKARSGNSIYLKIGWKLETKMTNVGTKVQVMGHELFIGKYFNLLTDHTN
jgi:hypothetical protein